MPSLSVSSFICFPSSEVGFSNAQLIGKNVLLNFSCTKLGSLEALGNNFVVTFMLCRASGGRKERNNRAVFARGEKGLKTVDTSVMNLVIMVGSVAGDNYEENVSL
jgi:hypothetical protein